MVDKIEGFYLLRNPFPLSCKKKLPCALRYSLCMKNIKQTQHDAYDNETSCLDFPCLKCTVKCIDTYEWLHNDHVCTSKSCTEETIVSPWTENKGLSRRTQHYGYQYIYNAANRLSKAKPLNMNPAVIMFADILSPNFDSDISQCIINEYTYKQGIAAHTDDKVFGPVIASISLISGCDMEMSRNDLKESRKECYTVRLEPGDVVIMKGDARYKFTHRITPMKKRDLNPNDPRRVSLTFRTIE